MRYVYIFFTCRFCLFCIFCVFWGYSNYCDNRKYVCVLNIEYEVVRFYSVFTSFNSVWDIFTFTSVPTYFFAYMHALSPFIVHLYEFILSECKGLANKVAQFSA